MKIDIIIEIPQDSPIKYELDKKLDRIRVDRFLHTAMRFPFNYGFIPETLAEDGDPADVLLIASYPIIPGAVLSAQIIGLLEMEDEAGIDEKIIAVPDSKIDPLYGKLSDVSQLDENLKAKIKHFFEHYKELETGKWVKIKNWQGREVAEKTITVAQKRYRK